MLVWTWNIDMLSGKGEVCEEPRKMIDVCHLQEVRWRGHGSRMLGWMEEYISCGGLENELMALDLL